MTSTKHVFETTDAQFDTDVLKREGLVIVDFWAQWCGPCRLLAPTLETLGERYQGKLKIFKIDVDANPNTAVRYQVKGIPALLFFKSGAILHQMTGMQSLDVLVSSVENTL